MGSGSCEAQLAEIDQKRIKALKDDFSFAQIDSAKKAHQLSAAWGNRKPKLIMYFSI